MNEFDKKMNSQKNYKIGPTKRFCFGVKLNNVGR